MQFFNAAILFLVSILLSTSNICFGQIKNDLRNATKISVTSSSFFLESFESHIPSNDPESLPFNLSGDNDATISTINVFGGSRSILSFIPLSPTVRDPRSELRHKGGTGAPNIVDWQHQPFTTRTFLFSYYFSHDMVFDPVEETIMQWKNQADDGCDIGNPPFSIRIIDNNIKYNIKYDSSACTTSPTTVFGTINNSLTRGVWHHFVVEIHYDYRVSNTNGYVKIWYSEHDPVTIADSVLNYQGPIGYNDQLWPYLKVGLYKSEWKLAANRRKSAGAGVTERKMWIDQVGIIEGSWQNIPLEAPEPTEHIDTIKYSINKPFVWPNAVTKEGETVKLIVTSTGNTELSYQWFKDGSKIDGASSRILEITNVELSDAGVYQVRISDSYRSIFSDKAKISVNEEINCTKLQVTAEMINESCKGNDGSIDLQVTGGNAPYTYVWSHNNPSTRSTLSNLSVGNYKVTVTDNQGCEISKTFTINTQPGSAKPVITENEGFLKVQKINGVKYEWYLNGSKVHESSSGELAIGQSGDYSVVIIDSNGCFAASDIFRVQAPTNDSNQLIILDLKVYPVPASTELSIDLNSSLAAVNTSYQIFSLTGNLEIQNDLGETARNTSFSIDINNLPPGVHVLKVKVLNEIIVRRFIKN